MNCPSCGAENPAGNKFCMACGADMMVPAGQAPGNAAPPPPPPSGAPDVAPSGYSAPRTPPPPPGAPGATPGGYSGAYVPPSGAPLGMPGYTPFGTMGSAAVQGRLIGFGPRFLAWLIDYVVVVVIGVVLNVAHLSGLDTLVNLAYFIYFWSTTGQTLGMMAMRIRVARVDGQPLTVSTGILRVIGYIISAIPLGLGLWWVIWDPQKQGWHDKIASTVVVPAQ